MSDERSTSEIPVVFIAGHGRSGSTLVSRVLGHVPGLCSVGELRYLWEQGVRKNQRCGCGERFHDCEFWTEVGKEAFGGWQELDLDEIRRLHRTIVRNRYVPLQLAPWLSLSFRRRLNRYTALLRDLYAGIQAVSGCEVIVDSSKFPSSAFLLRHVPGMSVRTVHLVRGSRGVCYSWAKRVERADRDSRLMARHGPAKAALEWLWFNACVEVLRPLGGRVTLLRYEDFVAAPRKRIEGILDHCGQERTPEELNFITAESVMLDADHSVAGNPMRVRTGRLPLRLDDEWRTKMRPSTQRLVTALTLPGLIRYGYFRPRRR
ncbi:MAG TPA: sulfotransferase [Actinoallomurus sp.]|jgi:hypothetical protein|nr:sulfotransferase [Actinoallomurus sp.]